MQSRNLLLRLTFFLQAAFLGFFASAIDLTNEDLSHQYDPDAPVQMTFRVSQKGNVLTVHFTAKADSLDLYQVAFYAQGGYESSEHRELSPTISTIEKTNQDWIGSFTVSPNDNEGLLVVEFTSDFPFYFDIPLRNGLLPFPSFYPFVGENPVTTSYLPTLDFTWSELQKIQVFEYPNRFGPAEAPMEEMKALAPIMNEDTVFFMEDSVRLKDYKLYYFKDDTLADVGVTLFKVPPYYPSMRKIGELVAPMKYITTEAEYRALLRSNRKKRTFDEFWINTYGTKFRARNAIRKYFQGVENANRYFSVIKEGWKTDRGMIFIIYGTPIEMYRNERGEKWVYEDEEFEFIKVSTLFGDIYALRKDKRYEKDWYRQVGDIRRGE